MIEFDAMQQLQMNGSAAIDRLPEAEKDFLKYFSLASAQAYMRVGAQTKSSVEDICMNCVKQGLAMGLQLAVVNGQVQARS